MSEYVWFYIKSGCYVHNSKHIVNLCRPQTDLNRLSIFVSSFVNVTQGAVWGTWQCEKRSLGETEVQHSGGLPSELRGCPQSRGRHNHQETPM